MAQFYQHGLINALSRKGRWPSYIGGTTFLAAVLDFITPGSTKSTRTLDDFRTGIEKFIGNRLETIEGNTNDGGSREGIGVFRRTGRTIDSINRGFIGFDAG